ncbi:MAG: T9SS type A sorting domain-containing protein, partial [Bacteroidia bacterium]
FADTVGIMPGSSGANVIWDFSQLKRVAGGDSAISNYYAASSTAYAQDFPNANIATNSVSGGAIAYYNITDTKVELQGIVSQVQGTTVKQFYSNPYIVYTLPMTYNYTFNDNFAATYTANSIDVYRNGTSAIDADGYGTLIIGNRTFENVLRLHNVTQTRDSIDYEMTSIVTVVDMESWVYMTPTKKEPILTISHVISTNNTTGQSTRGKSVTFNSKVISTGVKESSIVFNGLSLYPNPTAGNCNILLKAENEFKADIQVVNQIGQAVKTLQNYTCKPGENVIALDLNDMASGLYFVQIKTGNGLYTEKFIKK